ncbi:1-aminocyclopropane-1-carboxylate deaminase/D-cysteine desulfhydrase [Streptomyces aidingensis]|uniref:1-aminocyclopropane-1-carboxylate deaminase/D-cysteine desulfhydrase n=1 Tax=Streptomyces aidingensis TaxID=910347 RepID=UPI000B8291ED|nr:pyridoxal-phosphate dependent enzyme [Streptomyces aidingensis]
MLGVRGPSPLEEVRDERFARHGVRLLLKRDDLLHPEVTGNKWRKLVPNLDAALAGGHRSVLTFGGAWSNHLRATAAAGRLLGLRTIGVVRGEELAGRPLNPSLARCAADGMRLHFVSRADYRERHRPEYLHRLCAGFAAAGPFAEPYVVPEGGSNALAVRGCAALGRELDAAAPPGPRPHLAAVPCGTGGTLAGLAAGLGRDQSALGIPVLKGGFLADGIRRLQCETYGAPRGDWRLDERFHHGGYARTPAALTAFAEDFAARHGVPVPEPVYVAKLLWALTALTAEGAFPPGTVLAAVITG